MKSKTGKKSVSSLKSRFDSVNCENDLCGVGNKIKVTTRRYATVACINTAWLGDPGEFIPASSFAFVAMNHERGGDWRQVSVHGVSALGGKALAGGNARPSSDDTVGGIWKSCVDSQHYFREDLPEGTACPEGFFKDVGANYGRVGLGNREFHGENATVKSYLERALDMFDEYAAAARAMYEEPQLVPPRFFCTPNTDGRIEPRFANADDPEHTHAVEDINNIVARRSRDASWSLPGMEAVLTAGERAEVVDVRGDVVTLQGESGSIERSAPTEAVRQHLGRLFDVDTSDLELVPIVIKGRVVGPTTPLFGPVEQEAVASVQRMYAQVAESDGDASLLAGRRLHMLKLYAIAAEGRVIDRSLRARVPTTMKSAAVDAARAAAQRLIAYPVSLVIPTEHRQLMVQVADAATGWDVRIQRVKINGSARSALTAGGRGFHIDLYNTSQRKWAAHKADSNNKKAKA